MLKRRTLAVIVALMGVSWSALPGVAATTTFAFEAVDEGRFPAIQPGDVRTIATYGVPAELVGLSCAVSVTSTNDESVHVNNFVRITSNGDSLDVLGTEDGINGVHTSAKTIELGSTVVVTNHIGRRALGEMPVGTSVRLTIGVTCTTDDTTTSTSPTTTSSTLPPSSTTSTIVTTSTTAPEATTTTLPASSTTVPDQSTTTTGPPPSTSTTTPGSSTSTTTPNGSTSTSIITGSTVTTVPPVTGSTLPLTGPETDVAGMVMAGLALLALGGGLVVAGRER
jgi:LPXTG-motif cell wall-anchored protein